MLISFHVCLCVSVQEPVEAKITWVTQFPSSKHLFKHITRCKWPCVYDSWMFVFAVWKLRVGKSQLETRYQHHDLSSYNIRHTHTLFALLCHMQHPARNVLTHFQMVVFLFSCLCHTSVSSSAYCLSPSLLPFFLSLSLSGCDEPLWQWRCSDHQLRLRWQQGAWEEDSG